MKKILVISIIGLLILTSIPIGFSESINLKSENVKANNSQKEIMQVTLTIHTLTGKEKLTINVPSCFLDNSYEPPSYQEILTYCTPETKTYISNLIEKDLIKLSQISKKNVFSQSSLQNIKKNNSSTSKRSMNDYFINYLCQVKGVGLLLLFPPFLPITPILWAGLLIFNTNGTMGEINKAVEQAVMMPFIGLSFWWVQGYVFAGYAGIAIGFSTTDDS